VVDEVADSVGEEVLSGEPTHQVCDLIVASHTKGIEPYIGQV
jgi:hypothetical protein